MLLPIGGVSKMERLPEAPSDELAVARRMAVPSTLRVVEVTGASPDLMATGAWVGCEMLTSGASGA